MSDEPEKTYKTEDFSVEGVRSDILSVFKLAWEEELDEKPLNEVINDVLILAIDKKFGPEGREHFLETARRPVVRHIPQNVDEQSGDIVPDTDLTDYGL